MVQFSVSGTKGRWIISDPQTISSCGIPSDFIAELVVLRIFDKTSKGMPISVHIQYNASEYRPMLNLCFVKK